MRLLNKMLFTILYLINKHDSSCITKVLFNKAIV